LALGDDLEGEVGLRWIHRQHREIVDDEEVVASVTTECTLELAVDLGTGEPVEHAGRGGKDDATRGLASAICEDTSEEGLAGACNADEQRVDTFAEER